VRKLAKKELLSDDEIEYLANEYLLRKEFSSRFPTFENFLIAYQEDKETKNAIHKQRKSTAGNL